MTGDSAPAFATLRGRYAVTIVQFFRYALASLAEVKDYLKECEERGVIDAAELARFVDRCEHTKATATKFMKPHLTKVQQSNRSRRPR